MNVEPGPVAAVNVTGAPTAYACEHDEPQLMAPSAEVTVPEPFPVLVTVSVNVCAAKLAVTERAWDMVI